MAAAIILLAAAMSRRTTCGSGPLVGSNSGVSCGQVGYAGHGPEDCQLGQLGTAAAHPAARCSTVQTAGHLSWPFMQGTRCYPNTFDDNVCNFCKNPVYLYDEVLAFYAAATYVWRQSVVGDTYIIFGLAVSLQDYPVPILGQSSIPHTAPSDQYNIFDGYFNPYLDLYSFIRAKCSSLAENSPVCFLCPPPPPCYRVFFLI